MTELETRLTDALKALSTQWDADLGTLPNQKGVLAVYKALNWLKLTLSISMVI